MAYIEFKNVVFEYGDKQQVLKDISFEIPAGQTVGLVGPSGEGKTTIIKLILSLLPIKHGKMMIRDSKSNHPFHQNILKDVHHHKIVHDLFDHKP